MAHGAAHHHGPDHVPHVTPLKVYIGTWLGLMVLTVITVGASYIHLGTTGNLLLALFIATIKASLVAAFFMHLLSDSKMNTLILISGVVFLIVFVAFTMFDTGDRGYIEKQEKARPEISVLPFGTPEEIEERKQMARDEAKEKGTKVPVWAMEKSKPGEATGHEHGSPAEEPAPTDGEGTAAGN